MKHKRKILILILMMLATGLGAQAQVIVGGERIYDIDYLTPKTYEIGGITVENGEHFDQRMILLVAGLQVGDVIKVPGDKISTAIDNLWNQGLFDDVQVRVTRIQDDKIFLNIVLQERPKLLAFRFRGISGNDADKLLKEFDVHVGAMVTDNMIQTTTNKARAHYAQKGFTNVKVDVQSVSDTAHPDQVVLVYKIDKGKRVKIDSLIFEGNEKIATKKLKRRMKTHDVHYAKSLNVLSPGFWRRSKYREAEFNEDLEKVVDYYNEKGYRDARIVMDTMWQVPSEELNISKGKKKRQDRVKVLVRVHEGNPYYFRNITFSGNTVYTDEQLYKNLRISKGDPYNRTVLENNLTYNPSGTDISSMYMDNGYLFFNATPVEVAVENDSIDIEIRIYEGKQARIRNVTVEGNTVTNDKIIMRELHTKPGDLFNREALLRSRRELITLGYFKEETLIPEPRPDSKNGTVDIVYKVEENQTSKIQLQGGYGNRMIIGQLGLELNNFSARNIFNKKAWQPLPAGDGQRLSFNIVSNGSYYYSFGAGFTEPWLGGKRPQSLSVNAYHMFSNTGYWVDRDDPDYKSIRTRGATVSLTRRLKWPDDYFFLAQSIQYKFYTLNNYPITTDFKDGHSHDLSYSITLMRNSYDSPIYTRSGSELSVMAQLTPPYSLLSSKDYTDMEVVDKYKLVEYYKINIRGSWMLNLIGDVVLNTRFRLGYLGYYNKNIGTAPFGRYYLGGDALASYVYDGREVVPMRGYENYKLSSSEGSAVYDRFTLELRQPIIESAAATIWALGFLEGGNAWNSIKDFEPFKMYNSAGLGIRLYMPMIGLIGFDWGYGFDGLYGGSHFHFSIGTSID
ncbi:MAG: outer membrane protein assembly factor BamA [Bacteroidales bacterium]|nr:outer membrane protein assembly factor BamA [Bacteroidales bacterium]